MGEADGEAPRALIFAAAKLIQRLHRAVRHFIIIFHLIADFGDPCTSNRVQIMIPPINSLTWFTVIRCPAKVGQLNIGCGAGFKAMRLVRALIMHLFSQNGVIAMPP